jgi:NHL repeat
MSIRRAITLASALALTVLPLTAQPAGAHTTRELVTSFGSLEGTTITKNGRGEPVDLVVDGVTGLAVDLETGNVYVADNRTQSIHIFGAMGGSPADGVPSEIAEVYISNDSEPSGVAVDNSCYEHEPRLTGKACEEYDPSYGDVYVMYTDEHRLGDVGWEWGPSEGSPGIQKFKLSSKGEYELAGEIDHDTPTPLGVGVDPLGNVYLTLPVSGATTPVLEFKKVVQKVVNGGGEEFREELEELQLPQSIVTQAGFVAVDGRGDVYVGSAEEGGEGRGVAKLKMGSVVSEEVLTGPRSKVYYRPVAVDPVTGVVYVGNGSEVAEYNSAGEPQLTFGSSEPLGGSLGERSQGIHAIAVNGSTGLIYVANELHGDVDVFGGVVGPPVVGVSQPSVSSVTGTSALIAGAANPEGKANYYFEYVPTSEYAPAAADPYGAGGRTAIEALPAGDVPETVERVVLTGLLPGTTYHYRMVASNAAQTTYGPDETFTTSPGTPPLASTGPAGEVGATSATLSGTVDPRGVQTSYVFEVGTSTSYGGAKLFGNAGSSTGEVLVTVGLKYLVPGVTYHYRLVAQSFDGTSSGQDVTFTTPGVSSPISQPSSTPLVSSPSLQFPSIAGAITQPVGATKTKKTKKTRKTSKVRKVMKTGRRKRKAKKARRGHG